MTQASTQASKETSDSIISVTMLHSFQAEMVKALKDESLDWKEQFRLIRQDLAIIMTRLPGGTPALDDDLQPGESSNGSLLSEESTESHDEDVGLLGEIDMAVATCPELAEMNEDSRWCTEAVGIKMPTCPELEPLEETPQLSRQQQQSRGAQQSTGTELPKRRMAPPDVKLPSISPFPEVSSIGLLPAVPNSASVPADPKATQCLQPPLGADIPGIQRPPTDAQPRRRAAKHADLGLDDMESWSQVASDLPGQCPETSPERIETANSMPEAVKAQEEPSANAHKHLNSAQAESMPELPEMEEKPLLAGESDEGSEGHASKDPISRRRKKLLTYPLMVSPDDTENSETEPLIPEEQGQKAAPKHASSASSSAKPAKPAKSAWPEHPPFSIVPSVPSQRSSSSLGMQSVLETARRNIYGTGRAVMMGASAKRHSWNLVKSSSSDNAGHTELEQLEQCLARELFSRQNLIHRAGTPRPTHKRFALPSQRSRLRKNSYDKFPAKTGSLALEKAPEERPSSSGSRGSFEDKPPQGTGRGSRSASKLNPQDFCSEPSRTSSNPLPEGAATLSSLLRDLPSTSTRSNNRSAFTSERTWTAQPTTIGSAASLKRSFAELPSTSTCSTNRSSSKCTPASNLRRQEPGQSPVVKMSRESTCEFLRRQQEQALVKEVQDGKHVSFGLVEDDDDFSNEGSKEPTSKKGELLQRYAALLVQGIPRVCGILPWSTRWPGVSTAYQRAATAAAVLCTVHFGYASRAVWGGSAPHHSHLAFLDMVVALGGVVSLLACGALRSSKALAESEKILHSYAARNKVVGHWSVESGRDLCASFVLWIIVVLGRIFFTYFQESPESEPVVGIVGIVAFAFVAFLNLGLVSLILHSCRGIAAMLDTYCHNVVNHPDFSAAVREWNLLQAISRAVCRSIQNCFVVLLTSATLIILLILADISNDRVLKVTLAPAMLLALAIYRISVWAAAVTDKCTRVPLLVNSISVGLDLDVNRMYVVQYIVHTQAGFYVFEVRLTCSTLMKAFYIACAVTVGMVTQF